MKAQVTNDGVLIPKALLEGIDAVEIRKEGDTILVVPLADPILGLGSQPLDDEVSDASQKHDYYSTAKTRYTLEQLLASITEENTHAEIDTGELVGNEVW